MSRALSAVARRTPAERLRRSTWHRAILELRHKFPHGPTREQQDAFYDATVGGLAFTPPSGDKPPVTSSLWSGSNKSDATVPVNAGRTSLAARKKAQAAAVPAALTAKPSENSARTWRRICSQS